MNEFREERRERAWEGVEQLLCSNTESIRTSRGQSALDVVDERVPLISSGNPHNWVTTPKNVRGDRSSRGVYFLFGGPFRWTGNAYLVEKAVMKRGRGLIDDELS